ncbi:MAG: hypothetical protein RJA44_2376 [Pseudomonadota bacterium]|jgi:16S rRNA (uracil1498-N3)-methyltransferase
MPRFHADVALSAGAELELPAGAARHVQVLRMQPGQTLTLFNSRGGEWQATITRMGRQDVAVRVDQHDPVERELAQRVTLAACVPANDRFDWLVEKATELGADAIQPLMSERTVLRLAGERAERKREHWQGVACAAAEQSGRTRVPQIAPLRTLASWIDQNAAGADAASQQNHWILSLGEAQPLAQRLAALHNVAAQPHLILLSGPEGGFSPAEEARARACQFLPVSLGSRTLRAETAPLAVLAALGTLC